MIVRKSDGWLIAKSGEELVMMNAESGNYVGLSVVGARIWELLDTHHDSDAVCSELCKEYDVSPDRCHHDVELFLRDLEPHGAIVVDRP